MDPQSQAFTPYSSNDTWRLQTDVVRVQQVQAEHSERLARLERRQDEDARVKSVWGNQSPFPSVLSGGPGGTPNQAPLNQPPSDHFRNFDDEANSLMNSLTNLDAEDDHEPRRGLGAASRANSVRFDETANQNHFTHSSRPSVDLFSRSSSAGLGSLQMNERTPSHKSEGRASSAHSMRSAASGRANSLNLETTYGPSDSRASPLEPPAIAPGMLLLGSVPAIIRCWMNMNFKHDALLYAAICTGSHKSFLDLRLAQKLGYDSVIRPPNDQGVRTIRLPIFFPEAVPHPASSRSSSPAPQLPNLTVDFQVMEGVEASDDKAIQIFIGSDMLRAHSADVLFSSNSMTVFDNERHKLSIPLVRPENEAAFKSLYITNGTPSASFRKQNEQASEQIQPNQLDQGSSAASVSSGSASPRPTTKYRPPGALAAESLGVDSVKAGAGTGSDSDVRPASRQSNASRPSLNLDTARSEAQDSITQSSEAASTTTPFRSGSSPAIWSSWRKEGSAATPAPAAPATTASSMDWGSTSRNREASYQRRDTGIKVLKPKIASRTFSSAASLAAGDGATGAKSSRFFDDGRRRTESESKGSASTGPVGEGLKTEGEASGEKKAKSNPIGTGSAFSWLNGPKHARSNVEPPDAAVTDTHNTSSFLHLVAVSAFSLFLDGAQRAKRTPHIRKSAAPSATATTASAQKRRKVGLFGNGIGKSAASSSPPTSGADSPSPTNSSTTRGATPTPPRFLPPYLHDEVGTEGGASPSSLLADVSLDGVDMSGSEGEQQRKAASPGRTVGVRSASPAKRSAADMEGEEKEKVAPSVLGSFTQEDDGTPTHFDEAMGGMTPDQRGDASTQETAETGVQTSAQDSMATTNTSATSFEFEEPPPYSATDITAAKANVDIPSIDEQVRVVTQLVQAQAQMDEGQMGFVVSSEWLARVVSRSTDGIKDSSHPKEAREGLIGPIDNLGLVPERAFEDSTVKDEHKKAYIPLKPGLVLDTDYQLLPEKAWGHILGWYGLAQGQKQIVRYAHNTAPTDAIMPNFMWELYPPVFTIRKVPQPAQEGDRKATPRSSLDELRKRAERKERGQLSAADAFRLVSSRSEKFQNFLRRAKEAAEIPFSTKVKIWKISKNPNSIAKGNPTGVPSPPQSRSTSPISNEQEKLVISSADFNKMEECEVVDGQDQTGNTNYNGSSTMDLFQLFEDATLVLEEQIGGPAGGEYASDKKPKHTIKVGIPGRATGSKAPSVAPSRGTSPAPGGMMTRGRQRRDGRTRGTVGLSNLGNTCYMNSALQCIRSVEELAIYFLSNKYKSEVNSSNLLGHGGMMAKQYASLLSAIYSESAGASFSPSAFKKTLGSIQPLFSGYGQQDSQEFLSFLVDALHEDLNRIIKKPYNENPDSDDSTVRDPQAIIKLGEVYRANHKARNESIAMDLFNGFYKNTMECPECSKISITFDPYSLVTVQLPIESTFSHKYVFVPLSSKPIVHDIDMDKNSTVKALKEYIASKHDGVQADRLWMGEVYNHKLYKVFEDAVTLADASIGGSDHIFIWELPHVPSNAPMPSKKRNTGYSYNILSSNRQEEEAPSMDDPRADQFAVPVFSRQKSRYGSSWEMILHPTYVVVTREEAKDYNVVLKKALIAVSRLTTLSILTELDDSMVAKKTNEVNGTGESNAADDKADFSDQSASEDGYVQISKHDEVEAVQANGPVESKGDRPIPSGFMDPSYKISPALRNHLFSMKCAKSSEGMHCTGMSSINDRSAVKMGERVKELTRQTSMDSSTSGDESTTSTASGTQHNGEAEGDNSDDDFGEKPDIVVGEATEDALSLPTRVDQDSDSEELPDDPLLVQKPGGRKGGQKQYRGKNKGRNRKQKGYGKRDRRKQQSQPNGNGRLNVAGKALSKGEDDADNPYYIKLGEGIVLDWYPEAADNLFGGDPKNAEDQRGHFTSSKDGTGVDVFPDAIIQEKRAKRAKRKHQGITLDECFAETGKREVLSEDNAWYCGNCKELRRAAKTLEIWTIPDILVVHLKRFGGTRSFKDKLDVLVNYPIEGLDMTDRIGLKEEGKEYIYDLFAVDNHYGGLGGGHYTAYAKNFYDGQWYDYNDAMCSKLGERTLQNNAAAYLLFYRRRSPKPLGPEYLQDLVTESRNPTSSTDTQQNEDTAEESDSGEGRLGGPNGSLRGSPGRLTGAEAGVSNALVQTTGSGGTLGARQAAGSSLMTSRTEMNDDGDGKVYYGPQRPPHMEYGNQGSSGWDFGGLDGDGSDDGSTIANVDMNEDEDQPMPDLQLATDPFTSPADAGTPNNDAVEFSDDHRLYSGTRDDYEYDDDGTLYLENAGDIGADAESNSTVELQSPGRDVEEERIKLD